MAGAGTGNSPCADFTIPPPTFSGEASDPIGAEPLEREHRADDVDDRVEGADFVKVDLLDRHLVNRGFRLREPLEERLRAVAPRRRERRLVDQARRCPAGERCAMVIVRVVRVVLVAWSCA